MSVSPDDERMFGSDKQQTKAFMLNLLLGLNLDYKCKAFSNLNEIMCKLQRMKFMGDFQYLACRKSDCCII